VESLSRKSTKILAVFFLTVFCVGAVFAITFAQDWQQISGDHFIVYFTQDKKFAEEVADKAEYYYRNIATDIGYPRYSEFWTWDKRVKIYIYPDRASFQKATSQPDWSEGMADYTNKQIVSYAWSKGFNESLLPHEMAHLIFRDFVGFRGEIPLWLDEGVAQWAEEPKRRQIKAIAKKYYEDNALLAIDDIMNLDIRNLKIKDQVYIRQTRTKDGKGGVLFLSLDSLISTYYIEAVSLVGFLIEHYGSNGFAHFCRELKDGKSVEEALRFAYPEYIHSLRELEDRWREYLNE
jgi:hypothetical protein